MPSRTAVTATVALTVTVATGAIAFAAVTPSADGPISAADAATKSAPGLAPDPPASADAGLSGFLAATASTAPVSTSAGPTDPVAAFAETAEGTRTTGTPAASPTTSPEAPEPVTHPTPTTTPAAPSPTTTPTTSPAPYDCFGSDDGMSEAQKQAREAYCQSHGFDG